MEKGKNLRLSPSPSPESGVVDAVYVRGAEKSYGMGKRRAHVLRGLNMTVKKGSIYGLLGASGCGKTTLLSCIVGRRSLDAGEVLVFGGEPGSPESGIPGRRVGYMPQELALYGEFTIKETLQYFGRIYKLPLDFVNSQMEFLFKLLDLPPSSRYVKTLSGGQQRRVSFAVALFHEPELLILDEPTVGVDPLLRQSIWNHLVRLSRESGKTVIITTHYIEEARQANAIGLMRSGHLLAEESPQNLLATYRLTSLEDVFLKLCMKDAPAGKITISPSTDNVLADGEAYDTPGLDNPAYVVGTGDFSVPNNRYETTSNDNSVVTLQKFESLAALSAVSQRKKDPDVIYSNEEEGVVGLTFMPLGEDAQPQALDSLRSNLRSNSNIDKLNSLNLNQSEMTKNQLSMKDSGLGLYLSKSACSSSSSSSTDMSSSSSVSSETTTHQPRKKKSRTFAFSVPEFHRSAALIRKNFTQTFRNIGMFLFVFLLPAAQAILFCLAIGHDPTELKMGVVNKELNETEGKDCTYKDNCEYSMYSCRYLRALDNTTIIQVPFSDYDEALAAARRGEIWGVIHFGPTFTDDLMVRQSQGNDADNETIIGSRISINLDWSNQQISLTLQRRLLDAFDSFSSSVLKACDNHPDAGSMPVTFMDPIYGQKNPSFTHFMAPGIILTIVFFIAVALTAAVFINERKQGLMDRCLVAGVTTTEILLAHLVNQFTVLVGQTALVLLFMLVVFSIPCAGSIAIVVAITLLQGLAGMCYGLLVSALCDEETSAIHLALGSFYPNLLLSGVMWPLEGMHKYLHYFSYLLPQTYAVESMRNVMARGWGIDRIEVYGGILTSLAWIAFLLGLSMAVIRIRKYTG